MSLRFHRSIRIAGVRINVGKKSFSASVGPKGATLNYGKKGLRTSLGLPGSGLSFSKSPPESVEQKPQSVSFRSALVTLVVFIGAFLLLAWMTQR